ncbi:MAG: hypothetical protein GTN89_06440 [Acidobacteria bacterium]|nr:hypothetical protein [Acidobacteriota bacterium]NIM61997.1 hypothetical protein [Acidobacteriota bacterium]NIO58955.1 hypothetical protein [Acidobacteriota bacterium]NIQ30001.1 hypothetical protein [Acidobacteriota bacterium]NIQ84080.1 hypothetical protein [Acidobacteriota bacterium]
MDRSLPALGAPRWVPLSYLGLAHLGLACACVVTVRDPSLIAGFFYHPKMIAVVHALTVGWISSSLIGVLYLAVGRLGFRATRLDGWLFVAWATGAGGLASHFWIEEVSGMVWSAGLLAIAILVIAARFGMALAATDVSAALKFPLNLAWLNLLATAFVGFLIGVNKTETILPGYSLHNVFAHAHLAALGWAFLTVIALAHLFLLLHAHGPFRAARWNLHGALLTQVGAAGIFVSLLLGEPYVLGFSAAALVGLVLCVGTLVAHARNSRPPLGRAVALPWILGFLGLVLAAVLGQALLRDVFGDTEPDWIMAYGVAGLLAGLGSMVLGLMMLWLRRLSVGAARAWPPVLCWSIATGLLLAGLTADRHGAITAGATVLLVAVVWNGRSLLSSARTG